MTSENGKSTSSELSYRNAMALAENLADLRDKYDLRITALENDVATLRHLIDAQTKVIGMALQNVMGSGSTVVDPHPEDVR